MGSPTIGINQASSHVKFNLLNQQSNLIDWDYLRDLSEISRGEGGENRGRVTTFWDCRKGRGHKKWAVRRGRVMKIYARDRVDVHPQKKRKFFIW